MAALLAAALGFVAIAPAAQAFTFDNTTNTNSDGSAKYADPDSRFSSGGNGSNGQSSYKFGNTTLQFGRQRQLNDERDNTDRLFNPNGRPGDDR